MSVRVEIGDDVDAMIERRRPGVAFNMGGMGSASTNFYNDAFKRAGYEDDARAIQQLWLDGKRDEAARVPDAMITEFQALGTADMVRARLAKYREVGVSTLKLGLDGVPMVPERFELLEQIVDLVGDASMKLYQVPLAPNPTKVMLIAEREGAGCRIRHGADHRQHREGSSQGTGAPRAGIRSGQCRPSELDDGSFIVESLAIIEFLEDFFPSIGSCPRTRSRVDTRGGCGTRNRSASCRPDGRPWSRRELAARLSEGSGEGRGVAGCDAGAARLPGRTARGRAPIAHGGVGLRRRRHARRIAPVHALRGGGCVWRPLLRAWDEAPSRPPCTSLGAALVAGGQKSFASTDSCHGEP